MSRRRRGSYNPWIEFIKNNSGSGMTTTQLSKLYKEQGSSSRVQRRQQSQELQGSKRKSISSRRRFQSQDESEYQTSGNGRRGSSQRGGFCKDSSGRCHTSAGQFAQKTKCNSRTRKC